MKAILIIFLTGTGVGSPSTPTAAIESIEFNTMRACKEAMGQVMKYPTIESKRIRFVKTLRCVPKGNESERTANT